MSTQQIPISNTALTASIAGILFFGPFIKNQNFKNINEEEKQFIQGYCKIGIINIWLFVITLITFIANYFYPSEIFDRITIICSGAICLISIVSIFACMNGIQLLDPNEKTITEIPHKETVLKSFTPLYNTSLRYQTQNFQTPYRWLKESIMWRVVFSFLTLIFGATMGMIIIAIILIRLFLLFMNIDIIPNNLKKIINHWFLIHPEEIMGYVSWSITSKLKKSDENESILQAKQAYSNITVSRINSFLQYISFIAILRSIHKNIELNYETWIIVFAIVLFIARALLTYRKYKKIPNIPILYEIWSLLVK